MTTSKYVHSGKVISGGPDTILNSGAIGSCVVIIAYDSANKFGVMAHVMLPDAAPVTNLLLSSRYAANAIEEMLNQMKRSRVKKENIDVFLVGGANVLKRENDSIGKDNLDSVIKLLQQKQLEISVAAIGGDERRTALLDIAKGCIYYTEGDSKQKVLWQAEKEQ